MLVLVMVVGVLASVACVLGALATVGAVLWQWSGLLRGLGLLLIWCQLYRLVLALLYPWAFASAMRWLVIGLGLWLVGHWLYAARWHCWRSRAAALVFGLPGAGSGLTLAWT